MGNSVIVTATSIRKRGAINAVALAFFRRDAGDGNFHKTLNRDLAAFMGISERNASRIVQNLLRDGDLEKRYDQNMHRELRAVRKLPSNG